MDGPPLNPFLSKIKKINNQQEPDKTKVETASGSNITVQETVTFQYLLEKIPSVKIEDLHSRLHFATACNYPDTSRNKPFPEWKMEIDDAPIFRYLYRNFNPHRHLEFGTWEGFGTMLCLEETNATVWTLNVPFGEQDPLDKERICYSFPDDQNLIDALKAWAGKIGVSEETVTRTRKTDCIGFIGRYYLERELGNRVCQIYCDSQKWDISNFPRGFFDSVLIDGGHAKQIVGGDSGKAFELVRPGGMILWHDFCMDNRIYQNFKATRGVMDSIFENWDFIQSHVQDLFWIDPSFILVGIRK